MSPEEKIEMGRKLIAEAEAEITAKKRNWPEEVRPGDCFERNGERYVMFAGQLIDLDRGGTWAGVDGFGGDEKDFTYLGKLDLTIRTAAHEPTGAELVGKVCEFSADGKDWRNEEKCIKFDDSCTTLPYLSATAGWFTYARIARSHR